MLSWLLFRLQPEALSVSAAIAATLGRLGVRESMLNINASFLESTIYIPSFPSFDVCIDYETKCATFLLLANVSSLFPKCSSTIPPYGIKKFPSTPQVVNVVGLPLVFKNTSILSTTAEIYLVSDSNDFSNANDRGFTTQCPKGSVQDPISHCNEWSRNTQFMCNFLSPI